MKKKDIIHKINQMAQNAVWSLQTVSRYSEREHLQDIADDHRGRATAYNQCAGMLASSLGLASMYWDKPAELKQAA